MTAWPARKKSHYECAGHAVCSGWQRLARQTGKVQLKRTPLVRERPVGAEGAAGSHYTPGDSCGSDSLASSGDSHTVTRCTYNKYRESITYQYGGSRVLVRCP